MTPAQMEIALQITNMIISRLEAVRREAQNEHHPIQKAALHGGIIALTDAVDSIGKKFLTQEIKPDRFKIDSQN